MTGANAKIKRILVRQNGQEKQVRPSGGLPSAYQAVEYIQSSGTQYINTGYIPNYNTKISSMFMHTEHVIDGMLFGTRDSGQHQYILWTHATEKSSSTCAILFNRPASSSSGYAECSPYPQGTKIKFEYNNNSWTYGNQSGTISTTSGSPTYAMLIFGLIQGGSVDNRKFAGRLYYFKIYNSGTLVRDFVPCYRKSDSVVGLYDLANNQFYTNSGSGTFTKGPDVN